MKSILVIFAVASLISCAGKNIKNDVTARPAQPGLTQDEAQKRGQRVSDVRYTLDLSIDGKETHFAGKNVIEFKLSDRKENLTLDFADGEILSLSVNDVRIAKPIYNQIFITLPAELLNKGDNHVVINYRHTYNQDGSGLYRAQDPEDGESYIYTDFEPYYANLFMPCFDQPDLKASYQLTVTAPEKWQVVSSTREDIAIPAKDGRKTWFFPESFKFSTYLISLHAGPYKVWTDTSGKIPLRLFARKALAKYVKAEEWFTITKQGFAFYNDFFSYNYPFQKYDQVIVPDFNFGAMENVAAVTFAEKYVSRGEETNEDRENRANTILHEMAHMWFGNLVTMRWWNDLWLNESFATYMAMRAVREATEFKQATVSFSLDEKAWAYWEDQLVTTHPIEADVPDTAQAFNNFDGITYGKGASVLKQLAYYIGDENFKNGIRRYFKKHEYGNAELKDFMTSLTDTSKVDLASWQQEWLRTSGVNTFTPNYRCENGKIHDLRIFQSTTQTPPILRHHRIELGLFYLEKGKVVLKNTLPILVAGAETQVLAAEGESCPDLLFANQSDYAYVKVKFDDRSLSTILKHLHAIEDTMTRSMLWQSLWNMVTDADLPLLTYLTLVNDHLEKEPETKNIYKVLETVHGRRTYSMSALYYSAQMSEKKQNHLQQFAKLEELFLQQALAAQPGSDRQRVWFDGFTKAAMSEKSIEKLAQLIAGNLKVPGLNLDQDRRWTILNTLSRAGHPQVTSLIAREKKRDVSHTGAQMAVSAEAALPSLKTKQLWFEKLVATKSETPFAEQRATMQGLFPPTQMNLRAHFAEQFFAQLPTLASEKSDHFIEDFTETLAPTLCTVESSQQLANFIAANNNLVAPAMKTLRVALQENDRCVSVKAVANRTLASEK